MNTPRRRLALLTFAAFAAISICTVLPQTSRAQGQGPSATVRKRQEAKMQELMTKLGMTDAQKAKAKTYHDETMKQIMAVQGDKGLTPDQKKTKLLAAFKDGQQKFMALLTPAQLEKLKKITAEDIARAQKMSVQSTASKPAK